MHDVNRHIYQRVSWANGLDELTVEVRGLSGLGLYILATGNNDTHREGEQLRNSKERCLTDDWTASKLLDRRTFVNTRCTSTSSRMDFQGI